MSDSTRCPVHGLLARLETFRASLPAAERDLFDAMLVEASAPPGADVQGCSFQPLSAAKSIALAATLALGLGVASLGTPFASAALAFPLDQST